MNIVSLRKPKLYFDTIADPSHVTFDDGKEQRRNFPWSLYVEAGWDYAELDTIKMEIGDWVAIIRGHNLAPLFQSIEERTLLRIRALAGLQQNREHEFDTFAVEIRFLMAAADAGKGKTQSELNLGPE